MANKHETWRWSFICPVVVMKRGICSQHLPTNVSKVFVKMVGENNKRAREKGEADTSVVWTDWHDDWRAVPISSGHLMFLQTAGKKSRYIFHDDVISFKKKKKTYPSREISSPVHLSPPSCPTVPFSPENNKNSFYFTPKFSAHQKIFK